RRRPTRRISDEWPRRPPPHPFPHPCCAPIPGTADAAGETLGELPSEPYSCGMHQGVRTGGHVKCTQGDDGTRELQQFVEYAGREPHEEGDSLRSFTRARRG